MRIHVWIQEFAGREHLRLQWIDASGKRRTRSAGTSDRQRAEELRCDLEADLNAGRVVEPSKTTWQEFRQAFETEYLPGVRPGTARLYQIALDQLQDCCAPALVRDVDARSLSRFVAWLRERDGLSSGTFAASTIACRLRYVRASLRWAAKQYTIPVPAIPAVKVPRRRPQPVPVEHWERLLERVTDPQLRVLLLCCWLAGLRLNEAYELRREETESAPWLNLAAFRIVFPASFVKADEDQWVPLDPVLRAALEALPRHESGRVFHFTDQRRSTDARICAGSLSQRVKRLARRAGVRLTVRALRRGFGCRYAAKVPAQVLQRLMRHSSISVTVQFYANVDQAAEEAVLGCNSQRNSAAKTQA